jgi:hypothetical protein
VIPVDLVANIVESYLDLVLLNQARHAKVRHIAMILMVHKDICSVNSRRKKETNQQQRSEIRRKKKKKKTEKSRHTFWFQIPVHNLHVLAVQPGETHHNVNHHLQLAIRWNGLHNEYKTDLEKISHTITNKTKN